MEIKLQFNDVTGSGMIRLKKGDKDRIKDLLRAIRTGAIRKKNDVAYMYGVFGAIAIATAIALMYSGY